MLKFIRAVIIGIVMALVCGSLAGGLYQMVGASRDDDIRREPPGQIHSVGSFSMHIYCVGSGSPTVVLEAGNSEFSSAWAHIQARLSDSVRVCAYDRAGYGWSEPSPESVTALRGTRYLRTLLNNANEEGPFVIAAHSLGGTYARVFARDYPDQVAALVLIDAAPPGRYSDMPADFAAVVQTANRLIITMPWLARIGVLRLLEYPANRLQGLPETAYAAARAFGADPVNAAALAEEYAAMDKLEGEADQLTTIGTKPVSVISAEVFNSTIARHQYVFHEYQKGLATLSESQGRYLLLEGSTHFSLLANEFHANQVADEILAVVEQVRSN